MAYLYIFNCMQNRHSFYSFIKAEATCKNVFVIVKYFLGVMLNDDCVHRLEHSIC